MPFHKNPFRFGNLFIMFKIKFPKKIGSEQKSAMKKAVETLNYIEDDDDKIEADELAGNQKTVETVILKPYDKTQRNTNPFGG